MTPITIFMTLLNENLIEQPILNKTSVDLIIYIKHYYDKQDEKLQSNFEKKVTNLFELINPYMNCVWRALGSQLSQEIRNPLGKSIEAVTLITFFLKKLNLREKPITSENLPTLQRTQTLIEDEAETLREQTI
jgi:hypothetical protein